MTSCEFYLNMFTKNIPYFITKYDTCIVDEFDNSIEKLSKYTNSTITLMYTNKNDVRVKKVYKKTGPNLVDFDNNPIGDSHGLVYELLTPTIFLLRKQADPEIRVKYMAKDKRDYILRTSGHGATRCSL